MNGNNNLPTTACQQTQMAARAVLDDLHAVPELVNLPAYRELIETLYLATRAAATLAYALGDKKTAEFTHQVADDLVCAGHL